MQLTKKFIGGRNDSSDPQEKFKAGMIHTFDPTADYVLGGVDSWLRDFFEFCGDDFALFGLSSSSSVYAQTQRNYFFSVGYRNRNSWLPDVAPLISGLVKYFKKLPEVLVVHRLELVPIVRLIRPKARLVLVVHTNLRADAEFDHGKFWQFRPWSMRLLRRFSLSFCECIWVYSRKEFDLISRVHSKVFLGEAGYNDSVFGRVPQVDDRRGVLWVGRFAPVKNPLLAIRSFAESGTAASASMTMVGDGLLRDDCEGLVRDLGLTEKVRFVEPQSQHQLAKLMAQHRVLLHVSHYEGAPRVLVEAAAQGMVLAGTLESNPERLGETERYWFCAESSDPSSVAAALDEAYSQNPGKEVRDLDDRKASNWVARFERSLWEQVGAIDER